MPVIKQFIRSGERYNRDPEQILNSPNSNEQLIQRRRMKHLTYENMQFIRTLLRYFRMRLDNEDLFAELGMSIKEFWIGSDELFNLILNNTEVLSATNKLEQISAAIEEVISDNSEKPSIQDLSKMSKSQRKEYWNQMISENPNNPKVK